MVTTDGYNNYHEQVHDGTFIGLQLILCNTNWPNERSYWLELKLAAGHHADKDRPVKLQYRS